MCYGGKCCVQIETLCCGLCGNVLCSGEICCFVLQCFLLCAAVRFVVVCYAVTVVFGVEIYYCV